ncbi:cyclic-phosphate processing receiver domain-containing protein [uncultured Ruegeria sp.]|uniref:cyclic-phosphate processing receiver domain-containing protein n=1 Tax=uncultured Ruegeria sp. TaxID=259304 RepID=UPI002634E0C4|nr:cyclic-phosphate processing receiver domain-containing protein [uncultured Ruegeria sp.]
MDVFLDDRRQTPLGWTRVYWPDQAIALLEAGGVTRISLDYDLGNEARGTGLDVLHWLRRAVEDGLQAPKIMIHTGDPHGRAEMQKVLDEILVLVGRQ